MVSVDRIPTFGGDHVWVSHYRCTEKDIHVVGVTLCLLKELADVRYGPCIPFLAATLHQVLEPHEVYAALLAMCKRTDQYYFSATKYGDIVLLHSFKELL